MSVKTIMDHCEDLYNDLWFDYVKNWKKSSGGKAIGYMPIYVPRELVYAAKMLPVSIMGAGDLMEIIKGDAYYQSYICHIPRSTIELGLSERLDCLDGMLFPAICDVIRNLSGMWMLLFPGRYAKYLDLPQNFDPEVGGRFYENDLKSIVKDLEGIAGVSVDDPLLNEAIGLYNDNRRAIETLYELRADAPHIVSTYELYLLLRAGNIVSVEEHTALLREYSSVVVKEKRKPLDNIRVVLSGMFCEQPPLGLIKSLEQSGCYIVDDDFILGARFIGGDIAIGPDPIKAIALAYCKQGVPTASRYIDKEEKGRYLVDQVKERKAEGVIFAGPSFCDPALLERPMLQKALNEANIPHTSFNYAENSGQFQVIREQTGTFSDSIKLWGAA